MASGELDPGTEVAGYVIDSVLGRGGMGVVYKARQPSLDRMVALKVIAPHLANDESFRERFVRESHAAAAIEHPAVVPIYETAETGDGLLFVSMRLIEGQDLGRIISRGPVDAGRLAGIVSQIGSALEEAHSRDLIHRDVKPANILVAGTRDGERAYLTDFGLAKRSASDAGLTGTGTWLGTVDYAPPEQIEGREVDGRADVYALGCVAFEALTGRPPFKRDSEVATLWAQINDPAPMASEEAPDGAKVPTAADGVIAKALEKNPDDRFGDATELAEAFTAAAAGGAVPETAKVTKPRAAAADTAAPATAPEAAPRPAGSPGSRVPGLRNALIGIVGVAVVVGVLAIAGVFGGDDSGDGEGSTTASGGLVPGFEEVVGERLTTQVPEEFELKEETLDDLIFESSTGDVLTVGPRDNVDALFGQLSENLAFDGSAKVQQSKSGLRSAGRPAKLLAYSEDDNNVVSIFVNTGSGGFEVKTEVSKLLPRRRGSDIAFQVAATSRPPGVEPASEEPLGPPLTCGRERLVSAVPAPGDPGTEIAKITASDSIEARGLECSPAKDAVATSLAGENPLELAGYTCDVPDSDQFSAYVVCETDGSEVSYVHVFE